MFCSEFFFIWLCYFNQLDAKNEGYVLVQMPNGHIKLKRVLASL